MSTSSIYRLFDYNYRDLDGENHTGVFSGMRNWKHLISRADTPCNVGSKEGAIFFNYFLIYIPSKIHKEPIKCALGMHRSVIKIQNNEIQLGPEDWEKNIPNLTENRNEVVWQHMNVKDICLHYVNLLTLPNTKSCEHSHSFHGKIQLIFETWVHMK